MKRLLWLHPEFWVLAASAAAWAGWLAWARTVTPACHDASFWTAAGVHWPLMVAAMMFPLLVGELRLVAARSLWTRRHRAMALYLCGYSALWLLYGAVCEALLAGVPGLRKPGAIAAAFLVAAIWRILAGNRSALPRHGRIPLPPSGWRADFACTRMGARSGVVCWTHCWASMLACASAGHAGWAMALVTAATWSERMIEGGFTRRFALSSFGTVFAARRG